jgi:hypothetical protein
MRSIQDLTAAALAGARVAAAAAFGAAAGALGFRRQVTIVFHFQSPFFHCSG